MNNSLNKWQEKTDIYLAEKYALECIILSLRFHFIRGGGGMPQGPSIAFIVKKIVHPRRLLIPGSTTVYNI